MTRGRPIALAACLLACSPARAPEQGAPGFTWPVPPGWKKETIPFPLDFAPELPYRGLEELRFMPGFFDPNSRGWWSYAFVWWIEGQPKLDTALLTSNMRAYFIGLARAVAEGKFPVDPSTFQVSLVPGEAQTFNGTLHVLDAFKTHKDIDLLARIRITECGDHTAVMAAIAPPPWTPEKAEALEGCTHAFRCTR
jgi:hypothetical protein